MMTDFLSIYRAYKDRVYNQALRMLGNRQEAEEAVQDIFLRIYRGLSSFRGDAQLSTWIFRIAANVCINRRSRKIPPIQAIDDETMQQVIPDRDSNPGPDRVYEKRELRERIHRCLSLLPPKQSLVMVLYYYEGLQYREIAEIAGMPIGTVGTCLHQAKNALRTIIRKEL